MATGFHSLKISAVEQLTEESVAVEFDVPAELEDTFRFLPGQYLTLLSKIDGEDVRRSYSICASAGKKLRVGIKRVAGGLFSTFAQSLKTGDVLDVMPPQGRFTCPVEPDSGREFVFIAAGSGITPILSIIGTVLENEPGSRVTLVYGNQMTSTIMFRTELEDLKDRHLENFHLLHVLSRESQDVELFSGRVDVTRVQRMIDKGIINPHQASGTYLCGPAEMAVSISEHLVGSGVDAEKIHTELFEVPGEEKTVQIDQATVEAVKKGVAVEVVLDGVRRKFALTHETDTVLKAAERSGLELPFSCAGGMCATCRCKVTDGKAVMDRNFSLDKWELEAGFVLACQSRPQSEKLVLDFDAA